MKMICKFIAFCGITIAILITPIIFTLDLGWYIFDDEDSIIGNAIGGITAPFIGILSIYLLYKTLRSEQEGNYQSLINSLLIKQRNDASNIKSNFSECDDYLIVNSKSAAGVDFFNNVKRDYFIIKKFLQNPQYVPEPNDEQKQELINRV